jgi:site-specific DNA-methyltransferase (adenine-specific)
MLPITLIQGDCFTELEQLIANKIMVDAIITDVPYSIKYDAWDNQFDIGKALYLCSQLIKPNGNILIFQGWSNVCKTKLEMDKYWQIQNWIIYDRIKGRGTKKQLVSTREDILWYCNGDVPTFNKIYSNIPKKTKGMGCKNGEQNRALTNIWYDISPIVPWSKERNEHPTQKPLALMERLITVFTNEHDVVLDFTMGSGTTGVACKQLNRGFIGIELDEQYFSIAKQRIEVGNDLISRKDVV